MPDSKQHHLFQGTDFTGANFAGLNLRHVDFSGSNLTEANFIGANLQSYLSERLYARDEILRRTSVGMD